MAVATYTKSGSKATTPAKLDKTVFGVEVKNHQLLKDAYLAYTANGRTNNAVTKRRGEVRGGGRKPWRQKGTGNARFGSSRNPIWRGGGVAFGPTGNENYSRKLNTSAKRQALRQALSLAAKEDRIKVIEAFAVTDGKVKTAVKLLDKIGTGNNTLIVVANKDDKLDRSTRNIGSLKLVAATYLNVYDVANADVIIVEKDALEAVSAWLGGSK
ncbi:50S ribosomal protein L4 [Candidatus Saccharibacteria bacterium]|nr:50S ribosomal protein L4 [Candidatus Saccharibacteria bacterium]